jgi:hypothetical protein
MTLLDIADIYTYITYFLVLITNKALPKLPLFEQAVRHAQQLDQSHPAVVDVRTSKSYSYGDLVSAVAIFRNKILNGRK